MTLGDSTSNVHRILDNEKIFGVPLYEIGLGSKIESYFYEMLKGPGAVRRTLEKHLNEELG